MGTTDYTALANDLDKYRPMLSEWHGGQWTNIYGFQSSGKVTNPEGLMREINDCVLEAIDSGDNDAAFELNNAAQTIYLWLYLYESLGV